MKRITNTLLDPFLFLCAHPLVIAILFALTMALAGCDAPDSYQAEHQILALPENRDARIAQSPYDIHQFVVERADGSVWMYSVWTCGETCSGIRYFKDVNDRIQTSAPEAKTLHKEDCVLGPMPR